MKFLRGTSYRDKYLACTAELTQCTQESEELRDCIRELVAERDAHKLQAETALAQLEEVATSLTVCMQERDKRQAQLDELRDAYNARVVERHALEQQLNATVAPKKRTSRAKPPAHE